MPKPIYSPPDSFSLLPLLQLLPEKSKATKLKSLNSSLYARYEKVSLQLKELESSQAGEGKTTERKSITSELAMLKQVLEWLDITPEQ